MEISKINLKRAFFSIFKQFFLVNLFSVILLLISTLFLDWKELSGKIQFLIFLQDDFFIIVMIFITQMVLVSILTYRWYLNFQRAVSSTSELLKRKENENLEFKTSLRWDHQGNKVNKDLTYAVAKTICAFLNSSGGTLIIGVSDDQRIIGLEADYKTLRKRDSDGFLLEIVNTITNYCGRQFSKFVKTRIENIKEKEICVIEVQGGDRPAYLHSNREEEFFVRVGPSSQALNIKEAIDYIKSHWPGKNF